MILEKLSIRDFRNYEACDLELSEGVTMLSGRNAQGKTNMLEAIYALSAGRSFRASKDSEMVRWGAEAAWVKGWISGSYSDFTLSFSVNAGGRKSARLNDVGRIKPSELSERMNAVAFIPDDLNLVKGSPSERRRFLDMQISQISPLYRDTLTTYLRTLQQKNALLKDYHETVDAGRLLDVFNESLLDSGSRLMSMRHDAVTRLAPHAASTYSYIAEYDEELQITYIPSVDFNAGETIEGLRDAFRRKMNALRAAEIARGGSLTGPQRDDIGLSVAGRPASTFGSQGQQRTVVIALKLAEAEVISDFREETPIVLLDDVLSELDEGRRSRLISRFLGKCQTVITATDAEYAGSMPGCKAYRVCGGEVRQL